MRNLVVKSDFNAELFTSCLQDVEQTQAGDAGKTVAVNRNLLIAMNDVDVVPGFKVASDLSMRDFVGFTQICQRASGKHNAPAKRIVGPIAFIDGDVVRGLRFLHQDGEVHSGRPAADNVDLHEESSSSARPNRSTPVAKAAGSAHIPRRKC